jgi:hypothetical protein
MSRAMKVGLMAEQVRFGNDEPSNRLRRLTGRCPCGGITPGGAVAVDISVGLSHTSGKSHLARDSGTGRWSGMISGDRCGGTWQAGRKNFADTA